MVAGLALVLAGCASAPASVAPPPLPPPVVQAATALPPAPPPVDHAASAATGVDAQAAAAARSEAARALRDTRQADRARLGADADLWARIRDGLALPDLDNDLVRKWEAWYAARPEYVARMTERGGRYLFHIVEEVDSRGLPAELALLPFIESAFNPQAMSSARAAGMWQFIPSTGREFDLKQSVFRDDRRDVLASTRAALDYLQQLHRMFNDWQLALAAYNWGQGSVQRAIARNRVKGKATDYSSLRMPDETRNYLPKLQAVKNIIARPQDFGLQLPALHNHPLFLAVPIERDIDVALAARLAGIDEATFQQFNPQHNKPVILAAGSPQLLLPYDAANRFVRELPLHQGPLSSWTAWVAPRTLKPADAARLVGMSETELRDVNRIPPRMLVKGGSTLLVPRSASVEADVTAHAADNGSIVLTPEASGLRRVAFKAGRKGDSVAAVARRYRVSPARVAQWNNVAVGARFSAGTRIVVMVPKKATPAPRGGVRRAGKTSPTQRLAKTAVSD